MPYALQATSPPLSLITSNNHRGTQSALSHRCIYENEERSSPRPAEPPRKTTVSRLPDCTWIVQSPLTFTETRKRYSCQLKNLDSPRTKYEIYLLIYLEADDDDLSDTMVNLIIRRWRITRVTDQGDDRARYTLVREFQRLSIVSLSAFSSWTAKEYNAHRLCAIFLQQLIPLMQLRLDRGNPVHSALIKF